jgi:hypothetical protein
MVNKLPIIETVTASLSLIALKTNSGLSISVADNGESVNSLSSSMT